MLKYTAQRVLLMLLTLLIITGICFVLVRMLPPVELVRDQIPVHLVGRRSVIERDILRVVFAVKARVSA